MTKPGAGDWEALAQEGDRRMAASQWTPARACYDRAWAAARSAGAKAPPIRALWIGLAAGEAAFRSRDFEGALGVYAEAFRFARAHDVPVVGNPLFHLRVGQCKYELASPPERARTDAGTALDDLSRALICGGVELFDGEDPRYLAAVVKVLRPPTGYGTWEESRGTFLGSSRAHLRAASGWLRTLLASRDLLRENAGGAPPPGAHGGR